MTELGEGSGRALPRLGILREITDSTVLSELFARGRVTRAELSSVTGISGPTIWESVRRLAGAGLLRAAGSQETAGRGRAATYYELAEAAGWVLALAVSQQGISTRAADMAGRQIAQAGQPPGPPGDASSLVMAIRQAAAGSLADAARRGPLRAVAMSVANPVRPGTREVIALPGSPFPEGMHLPGDILAGIAEAPLLIGNDVNLAALAERRAGLAATASSFAYAYVGAGLGLALYVGDQLISGAHGLAGEIGYLPAAVGNGQHVTLSEALARQGFRRAGAPSIDVPAVLDTARRSMAGDPAARTVIGVLGTSIGHAIAAACAIADPELVLLGGPIGSHAALLEPVRAAAARFSPAPMRIAAGRTGESAPLQGALHLALDHGRQQMATGHTVSPGHEVSPRRDTG